MTPSQRIGRPREPSAARHVVSVRLTDAEYARIGGDDATARVRLRLAAALLAQLEDADSGLPPDELLTLALADHAIVSAWVDELEAAARAGTITDADRAILLRLDPVVARGVTREE